MRTAAAGTLQACGQERHTGTPPLPCTRWECAEGGLLTPPCSMLAAANR